jgi:hypothetical protein
VFVWVTLAVHVALTAIVLGNPVANPAILDALPRLLESLSSLGYRCVSLP